VIGALGRWPETRWNGVGLLVALTLLWEVAGRQGWVHRLFLPPASRILASFWTLLVSGEVLGHVGVSLWRAALGYALAALVGIGLGVLIGYSRRAHEATEVVVELTRALPPPAIIPVAIVLLGIEDAMKVFVIFFSCMFPILVNTSDGVRAVDPVLLRTARTFGVGQAAALVKVMLPAASPFVMTGLRVALAIALILTVIAEMVGATAGIGYFILDSQRSFRIPQMYAGMLVLALLGYALNRAFLAADRRLMAWHRRGSGAG
jgi:ABC-type nitrate/sulfonate/bicarbonate transport system permease component